MSQAPVPPASYPPPPPYGAPMPGDGRRGNGMAITSLILGLLLCIPFITGLGGILFGVLGIKKTKDPRVGGKGLAVAGLVLGIINIIIWALFGTGIWALVSGTAAQRQIAKTFISDLSQGKVDAAAAVCDPTAITRSELVKASQTMKSWGALQDTTTVGINAHMGSGSAPQVVVGGAAVFANTRRQFTITLSKRGEQWKIVQFEFPP